MPALRRVMQQSFNTIFQFHNDFLVAAVRQQDRGREDPHLRPGAGPDRSAEPRPGPPHPTAVRPRRKLRPRQPLRRGAGGAAAGPARRPHPPQLPPLQQHAGGRHHPRDDRGHLQITIVIEIHI